MSFDFKSFLKTLTPRPGVYKMLSETDDVLYVGKAKNLKKRVKSYFNRQQLSAKVVRLMQQVCCIEVIVTATENEALLLECNLIKTLKPRYNILLRDDKSYPLIRLSDATYPSLQYHRGTKHQSGDYYGPYPSRQAVRQTLNLIEKVFQLRTCDDTFFSNRTRPCLQYQIKRCAAPCVGLISEQTYADKIEDVKLLLSGKREDLLKTLTEKMDEAAEKTDYEKAKAYRDQISALRQIQAQQSICGQPISADVIAVATHAGQACIELMMIREGMIQGNQRFYLAISPGEMATNILFSFIQQYYTVTLRQATMPKHLFLSHPLDESQWLSDSLSELVGKKIYIRAPQRGARKKWTEMASTNARQALKQRMVDKASWHERFAALQTAFDFDQALQRIECFDVSHTMGEATVASCVVFDRNGAVNREHRCYNITVTDTGDDYAAMSEALMKRYEKMKRLPDLILIDGGLGQYHTAQRVLAQLHLTQIPLVAVAKGVARKPGLETLFYLDRKVVLPEDAMALQLIQQIRDEAHRFAIMGHRNRRAKVRVQSQLEQIPGIGAKRRQQLLRYFGGLQGVKNASRHELAKVPGISQTVADVLYACLHPET